MRRAFLFILLCGCLTAQDSAGIQGLAIGAITRQPMPGVHITMRSGSPDALPSAAYGAISGPDGHFSIANMPPALYFLTAQHNGYVYSPSDASVTLKPGGALTNYTLEMTPRALIAGRVVDEYGDPVQHIEVTAVPASGSRAGESGMHGRTDERGQFRMTGSPGKFYVKTSATREMTFGIPEISADGLGPAACGATYYPGSETKDRASAVEVAAGHDLNGIDIHLARKRSLTISGTVTGMSENSPPARVLLLSDEGGTQEFATGPGGKFTVAGLTRQVVDVQLDSADKSGVTLTLTTGEALIGTVEIAGDPATIAPTEKLRFGSKVCQYLTDSTTRPKEAK